MGNFYKKRFTELINQLDSEGYRYFTPNNIEIDTLNGRYQWRTVKFNINKRILNNALELSNIKSKYTMNLDQAGKSRNYNLKIANQLKGILAEIGIHLLLEKSVGLKNVQRWDLERKDFRYSEDEYDLKFTVDNNDYICESRSSVSYKTSLAEFISTYHVIGPYTSKAKSKEEANHFYFRPVFQYKHLHSKNKPFLENEVKIKTLEDIVKRNLELYFVSGANKSQMFGNMHEMGTNKQKGSKYRQVRIINSSDIIDFLKDIHNLNY